MTETSEKIWPDHDSDKGSEALHLIAASIRKGGLQAANEIVNNSKTLSEVIEKLRNFLSGMC